MTKLAKSSSSIKAYVVTVMYASWDDQRVELISLINNVRATESVFVAVMYEYHFAV